MTKEELRNAPFRFHLENKDETALIVLEVPAASALRRFEHGDERVPAWLGSAKASLGSGHVPPALPLIPVNYFTAARNAKGELDEDELARDDEDLLLRPATTGTACARRHQHDLSPSARAICSSKKNVRTPRSPSGPASGTSKRTHSTKRPSCDTATRLRAMASLPNTV